jgi:hypothetical protein
MSFLNAANELINLAEPRVAQEEASRKQADPEAASAEIITLLNIMIGAKVRASEAAI